MINSYDDIVIYPECCLLIDLDDTILEFPGIDFTWWNSVTQDKWDIMMRTVTPILIDPIGWQRLHERITTANGTIIIVTARPESQAELTLAHLQTCGVHVHAVRHSLHKGEVVSEFRNRYKRVIFVDDNLQNCADVARLNNDVTIYPFMKPHRS